MVASAMLIDIFLSPFLATYLAARAPTYPALSLCLGSYIYKSKLDTQIGYTQQADRTK